MGPGTKGWNEWTPSREGGCADEKMMAVVADWCFTWRARTYLRKES